MNIGVEKTLMALHHQCIPVIRSDSMEDALWIAQQLVQVGFNVLELTLTTPHALDFFDHPRPDTLKNIVLGLGTLTKDSQIKAILNSPHPPDFIASPAILPLYQDLETFTKRLEALNKQGILYLAGAATPSEVLYALEARVPAIKWFPAEAMGGARTLKTLLAPFPDAKLIPFGGVSPSQSHAYWQAGAWAVGIGHHLMPSASMLCAKDEQGYRQYLPDFKS
jgi:2-dehydro-3-deoxyphosphogluconate aldolase/(4S)-4-hydroxy-2-oxoglutarate aldolase